MCRFNKDKKMAAKFAVFVLLAVALLSGVRANPAIGKQPRNLRHSMGYDPLELCIENCAQCKKMLGAWFEGPLCAESCIKYKGKLIPECEDFASISPFLNKL
ncbi:eclosion hormone isoform X1 [Aricia agestis]|uniref:eclosion hormone isoform X1 n=1 Tax=Aricia agestis TaxID=91739 RepID=UPI001C20967F|nr:eclosion hormone isoform X1 [Aricia agestis]